MTQPLNETELEEISNLAAEAERPERLRAMLAELLRLRVLGSECRRSTGRLPRKVQLILDNRVPRRTEATAWAALAGQAHAEPGLDIDN